MIPYCLSYHQTSKYVSGLHDKSETEIIDCQEEREYVIIERNNNLLLSFPNVE